VVVFYPKSAFQSTQYFPLFYFFDTIHWSLSQVFCLIKRTFSKGSFRPTVAWFNPLHRWFNHEFQSGHEQGHCMRKT